MKYSAFFIYNRNMKLNFIVGLLLLFFSVEGFAIRDATFIHRNGDLLEHQPPTAFRTFMARVSCSDETCAAMPFLRSNTSVESDQYNYYLYSDHFRVVYAASCGPNESVKNYAQKMLDIAEVAYQKQVVELSMNPPEGNEQYYTDIFLGKKSRNEDCRGFDYVSGEKVLWYDSYIDTFAGFASEHPLDEGVAYLVMNAGLTDQLLQVTLAHEIHHTIQFSYKHFEDTYFSNAYLDADLWILEAMATAMESIVYPDVDDYVYYVNRWYQGMNQSLDTFDGVHEYGAAVFPLYLEERFGAGTLNKILLRFGEENGWQSIVKSVVLSYGETFTEIYSGFIGAIWEPEEHFIHGAQFDTSAIESLTRELNPEVNITLNKLGIQPVSFSEDTTITLNEHQFSWTPSAEQGCSNWSGSINQRMLCRPAQKMVLFADRSQERVTTPFRTLYLNSGWNLTGFTTNDPRTSLDLFAQIPESRSANWSTLNEWSIENLAESETVINSLEPGWVYSAEERELRLLGEQKGELYEELNQGWNLVSLSADELTGEGDLEQFREQVAVDSGYSLRNFLFTVGEGWQGWHYEREVGDLSGIGGATALWLYLE